MAQARKSACGDAGANIRALTGVSPASGEIVLVKGGSDRAEPLGRQRLD
jgi:hypothetical protein